MTRGGPVAKPNWRARFTAWASALPARLRRSAINVLVAVGDPEPAGGVVAQHFAIDDGVDYSLPLVVPEWLTGEARQKFVTAGIVEASAQYHFQFDRPYLYNENPSQFPTASPLLEWDQGTRREIVSRSHLAYERNPLAKRAVRLNTQFSMGTGLTVTYANPDVEAILEEFRANAENDVESYEKTLCNDLQVDGELFIRFYKNPTGQTVIVPLPSTDFLWLVSEMGFKRRLESFHRQGVQSTGFPGSVEYVIEDIPAAEMLHVAINRHSYEVRGRPEMVSILPWLKAYKDWLEGRARQNHWRGSMLFDVTLDGAQPQVVTAKRNQYKQPPSPGSIAIHNDKEHWEVMESHVGAADVSEDGRAMKLMVAVGVGQPEYMLSDGQNSNLASASAQELPALKTFGDYQDVMVNQTWKPIYRHVLQNAIDAGLLPDRVQKFDTNGDPMVGDDGLPVMVDTLKAFDVAAPELQTDDPWDLTQALSMASGHGWVSDETASSKLGFDYTAEQKKRDREVKANQLRQAAGLAAGGFAPDRKPLADYNPNDDGAPGPKQGAVNQATFTPAGRKASVAALANDAPSAGAHSGNAPTESALPVALHIPLAAEAPMDSLNTLYKTVKEQDRQEKLDGAVVEALAATSRIEVQMGTLGQSIDKVAQSIPAAVAGAVAPLAGQVAEAASKSEQALTLAQAADLRERDHIAAMHAILEAIHVAESAPVTIALDENMVRQIAQSVAAKTATAVATQTAQQVISALETLSQEITERDAQGRAMLVSRVTANGTIVNYRILRDGVGKMTGLEKVAS